MKASGGRKFGELVELGFSCFPVMLCWWIRKKELGTDPRIGSTIWE
jgi:hypothetical protein